MRGYGVEVLKESPKISYYSLTPLGEVDRERMLDFLSFRQGFPGDEITSATGRSVFFPLKEPFGPYDSLQVSGAGFVDMGIVSNDTPVVMVKVDIQGKVIEPPRVGRKLFSHQTTYVVDGRLVEEEVRSPMGSYTEAAAIEKFTKTMEMFKSIHSDAPFLLPLPIGRAVYSEISDGQGGGQSALVFACPVGGIRAEVLVGGFLAAGLGMNGEVRPDGSGMIISELMLTLMEMGRAHRFLHDRGLCHYQLTMGNVSPVLRHSEGGLLCVYDWETVRPVDETDPMLAMALDSSVPIRSYAEIMKLAMTVSGLNENMVVSLGYSGFINYLMGYSGIGDVTEIEGRLDLSLEQKIMAVYGGSREVVSRLELVLPELRKAT